MVTTPARITPPVRHPEDGRWGVLVPSDVQALWQKEWPRSKKTGPSIYRHEGAGVFQSYDHGGRPIHRAQLMPPWAAYLRAHEFDPERGFEAIATPEGVAVFYLAREG